MSRRFITLPSLPSGETAGRIWVRCPSCREDSLYGALQASAMACPWCDFHFPLQAESRLDLLVDQGSFRRLETATESPCRFGEAKLRGRTAALLVGDPAVCWTEGEAQAIISLAEKAHQNDCPLVWIATAPRGASSEALWPGVQASLNQLRQSGLPWISLLAGTCYGPVASLALQADLVLAEPGAVVSPLLPEAMRQVGILPVESTRPPRKILKEGWADAILYRQGQGLALATLLDLLGIRGKAIPRLADRPARIDPATTSPLAILEQIVDPFFELHGDRQGRDDASLVGGLARLRVDGTRVLLLVTAHGQGWHDTRRRHSGAISPSGWHKAARLLHLAARFNLPVITLVGTPKLRIGRHHPPSSLAAMVGKTAETLLSLPVPTITIRLDGDMGLARQSLSATDCLLVLESAALELEAAGVPVDETFSHPNGLAVHLQQHLQELSQTYAIHGPLGRRKLLQRRYTRWARIHLEQ